MNWIKGKNGYLDLDSMRLHYDSEDAFLEDAHSALQRIVRCGGRGLDVARHCHLVMMIVAEIEASEPNVHMHALWALLHDVREVYVGDILGPAIRSLKPKAQDSLELLCSDIDDAIARFLENPAREVSNCDPVSFADMEAFRIEAVALLPDDGWHPEETVWPPGLQIPHDMAHTIVRELVTSPSLWLDLVKDGLEIVRAGNRSVMCGESWPTPLRGLDFSGRFPVGVMSNRFIR